MQEQSLAQTIDILWLWLLNEWVRLAGITSCSNPGLSWWTSHTIALLKPSIYYDWECDSVMLLRYLSARMYIPAQTLDLLKQYFFIGQLVIHEVQVKLLYACVLSDLLRVTTVSSWTLKGVHWFPCFYRNATCNICWSNYIVSEKFALICT